MKTIKLPKDKDYVYCYSKKTVIQEEDCDKYEYNCECDKNDDFWGRTHTRGSYAGYSVEGIREPILKSCNYCTLKGEDFEVFALPPDAEKKKEKSFLEVLLDMI